MTDLVRIEELKTDERRQRQEFDLNTLNELADSIAENGLLHPIVIRRKGRDVYLVAGERRLRAIRDLESLDRKYKHNDQPVPRGYIPAVTLGELSPIEAMEAEFEENVRRENLTWQEECIATEMLRELRLAQAKESNAPPPSPSEIAQERYPESGYAQTKVKDDLILARHLNDPEVSKAKTATEAMKVLRRKEDIRQRTELAERVGKTFSAKRHILLNTDALEWMKSCAGAQYDVIVTDPPYGINADQFGDSGGKVPKGEHSYDDSPGYSASCYRALAVEGFRVTKSDAHAYVFTDIDSFVVLKLIFKEAGWLVFRTPLIWYKPGGNRAPWPDQGPQRKWEMILFAVKGTKPVTKLVGDVLTYNSDDNLGHEAQKPVALFEDLLSRSVHPGDKILDPFAGSGPVFEAANRLQCYATGIELNPAHYALAMKRIEGLT